MAHTGVVIVSHSEKLAEGLAEIVEEMNGGVVPIIPAGGAGEGRIGTNSLKIQAAIEALADCKHILIYVDIGSSIISAETAIDMLDDEAVANKVQIVDCPIVEGAFAGVIQASVCEDIDKIIEVSSEARHMPKG